MSGSEDALQNNASFLGVDFSYVVDPKLRTILEQFHQEAVGAYQRQHYIAAVVLAGGVLEGMLTFSLKRNEAAATEEYRKLRSRSRAIAEWNLNDLIDISVKIGLVGADSARAAQAVRDFRNLIHPEKLSRRSNPRWDALATMALAAVAEVSRSISGRMKT